jgi:Fur family transcriptional regulator, ferric uptake regulator
MLDFQIALFQLRQFLKENKLRFTNERLTILEEIFQFSDHFDAEKLFNIIQNRHRHISLATIYRTLDLFSQAAIIKKENLGNDFASYELSFNVPHHDHLICVECGKVIEFNDRLIEENQQKVCEKYNMVMIRHQLQIFGRCKDHQ